MIEYAPQDPPWEALPSTDTPVTTEWLTQVDDTFTALIAGGSAVEHNTQTGTSYTLALGDAGKVVEMDNSSANVLTVPPNSTAAFPVGSFVAVRQYGAGTTTIAAGAGVTLRSFGGALTLAGRYAEATLTKRGGDEWVLSGTVTP